MGWITTTTQEGYMSPMEGVEISPAMQKIADESMQQARRAFDMYIAGVRQTLRAFGGDNPMVSAGERALNLAERNIASSFAFAQRFLQAHNLQEIVRLQAEYLNSQMQELMQYATQLSHGADHVPTQKFKSQERMIT
jgi:hypothetical protein